MNVSKLDPFKHSKEYAYKMGKDCAINGSNTINCDFAIFSSKENTKAWEQGRKDWTKQKGIREER